MVKRFGVFNSPCFTVIEILKKETVYQIRYLSLHYMSYGEEIRWEFQHIGCVIHTGGRKMLLGNRYSSPTLSDWSVFQKQLCDWLIALWCSRKIHDNVLQNEYTVIGTCLHGCNAGTIITAAVTQVPGNTGK